MEKESHNKSNKNIDKILNIKDFSKIFIIEDINCLFCCLSQFFKNYQENHLYYRYDENEIVYYIEIQI